MSDNAVPNVNSERGKRLETFMYGLLPKGSARTRSELARVVGVSRQQLIQWFEGKGEPRFSALGEAAERLNVRRVDLVAAYDGVTAPEQQETPRPGWAEGLEERTAREVISLLGSPTDLDAALRGIERLKALQRRSGESHGGGTGSPDQVVSEP